MNLEGKCISWWQYIEAFNADVVHPSNARAIPKITKEHLNLSNLMKMRVRLMTQVIYLILRSKLNNYSKLS